MWMTRSCRSSTPDSCSRSFCWRSLIAGPSEVQSALASAVGQRLHAAVIDVTVAVEHDLLDALLDARLGDRLADRARHRRLAALARLLELERRRRHERLAGHVVDDLAVDLLVAAEHGQPRAL